MLIDMPAGAEKIIKRLRRAGFEAYAVGGCVRDCLMGRVPGDWDITTDARPDKVKALFAGSKMIDIGERHGTIAIKSGDKYFEVTTFRVDGLYGDGRRPDTVSFTNNLREDLSRRDFTVNAMAYSHETGLVDYFGGHKDITNRTIRCVGDANQRFDEDYLRIMRAYRFSATLDFEVAGDVRQAALLGKNKLWHIAVERLQTEFAKLVVSNHFERIDVFFEDCGDVLFPEIAVLRGFRQDTPYHCFDVYRHTLEVMRQLPPDLTMRLAGLYHDVGKFKTRTTEEGGRHRFRGHAQAGYEIAKDVFKKWRLDNNTAQRVLEIIKYHSMEIVADRLELKRLIYKYGEALLADLLMFQKADNMAKSQLAKDVKLKEVMAAQLVFDEIIASGEPLKISELAIGGQEIMRELGIGPSARVGENLNRLMEEVLKNPEQNTPERLAALLHSKN